MYDIALIVERAVAALINSATQSRAKRKPLPDIEALAYVQGANGTVTAWSLPAEDHLRHLYVLGCTGCGKTNLLTQLVEQDIAAKRSVAILDLRGDLVDKIIARSANAITADRFHLIDLRKPEFS